MIPVPQGGRKTILLKRFNFSAFNPENPEVTRKLF